MYVSFRSTCYQKLFAHVTIRSLIYEAYRASFYFTPDMAYYIIGLQPVGIDRFFSNRPLMPDDDGIVLILKNRVNDHYIFHTKL